MATDADHEWSERHRRGEVTVQSSPLNPEVTAPVVQNMLLLLIAGALLWIGHSLDRMAESLSGMTESVEHIRKIQYDPTIHRRQRLILDR